MNPIAPQNSTRKDLPSTTPTSPHKRSAGHSDLSEEMLAVLPQPALNKRPKLSIQTSSLPVTFGKSSTALLMTATALPTASPTVLNTFNNAYDLPSRPSPVSASPFTSQAARRFSRPMPSYVTESEDQPYKLPTGVKSILRNSFIPDTSRRSSVYSNTSSPRNSRRVLFPPTKKVCFRQSLEEEIETVRFTARHSDLSSSEEESEDRGSEELLDESEDDTETVTVEDGTRPTLRSRKRPRAYSRRQVRAAAMRDGLFSSQDQVSATETPSDRRRRRRWEWTLGPLDERLGEDRGSEAAAVAAPSTPDLAKGNSTKESQGEESLPAGDDPIISATEEASSVTPALPLEGLPPSGTLDALPVEAPAV